MDFTISRGKINNTINPKEKLACTNGVPKWRLQHNVDSESVIRGHHVYKTGLKPVILVDHLPMEISCLMNSFLKSCEENTLIAEVSGLRKRENGWLYLVMMSFSNETIVGKTILVVLKILIILFSIDEHNIFFTEALNLAKDFSFLRLGGNEFQCYLAL